MRRSDSPGPARKSMTSAFRIVARGKAKDNRRETGLRRGPDVLEKIENRVS